MTIGRLILHLAGIVVLLAVGFSALAKPPQGYPFLPYDQALAKARAEHKPMFVYLGRLGCSTCNKVNAETFTAPEIRSRYTRHFVLAYIDTEGGDRIKLANGERITEADLAARMRILGTPTFFFLSAGGKRVIKAPGYKSIADFKAYDDYVTGGHYREQTLNEYLATLK